MTRTAFKVVAGVSLDKLLLELAALSRAEVQADLALWNRGGSPDDPDGALDRCREGGAITW